MKESAIEKYLTTCVKSLGGYSIKLNGDVGIPDRMVLLPGGIILFVELKTVIGRLSPLQKNWKKDLEKLGFIHLILRSKEEINLALEKYI